jgi:hypothetical protein
MNTFTGILINNWSWIKLLLMTSYIWFFTNIHTMMIVTNILKTSLKKDSILICLSLNINKYILAFSNIYGMLPFFLFVYYFAHNIIWWISSAIIWLIPKSINIFNLILTLKHCSPTNN